MGRRTERGVCSGRLRLLASTGQGLEGAARAALRTGSLAGASPRLVVAQTGPFPLQGCERCAARLPGESRLPVLWRASPAEQRAGRLSVYVAGGHAPAWPRETQRQSPVPPSAEPPPAGRRRALAPRRRPPRRGT